MIDPEFWSDEEIGHWSPLARLFYIGLWNFSDDAGRCKAHNDLLKAEIFPYDKKVNIDALKREVSPKVQWYEVNGSKYGYCRNFLKHQTINRPTPSKNPAPPAEEEASLPAAPETTDETENNGKELAAVMKRQAQEFLDYFNKLVNRSLSMTKARERIIVDRLKEGKTMNDLKRAADNFSKDDWPERHKFCDIIYCVGIRNKVDNLDKWLNAGKKDNSLARAIDKITSFTKAVELCKKERTTSAIMRCLQDLPVEDKNEFISWIEDGDGKFLKPVFQNAVDILKRRSQS
jgi:hypothetical protein